MSLRQYQPIWNQIKVHKKATVIVPGFYHARIIKAVMKERSLDIAFRNLLKKKGIRLQLTKESDPIKGTITFSLIEAAGIKLSDL